jgi:Pvc16 N-terminal domain
MADYTAIRLVSQALKTLLEQHITLSSDPDLKNVPIHLYSPKEMHEQNLTLGVSLWLYQVDRFDEMLNNPPPFRAPGEQELPALPVNLHYLITPIAQMPADAQVLIGRVLQTLNDHSALRGAELDPALTGPGLDYGIRNILRTPTLEELTRTWHALHEPYRLSVNYLVQMVQINSDHLPVASSPVRQQRSEYVQILGAT